MDISGGQLIASFLVSTVGFSIFLFGKKQKRLPQLLGGILLMGCPYFIASVAWIYCFSGATMAGIWVASRSGM